MADTRRATPDDHAQSAAYGSIHLMPLLGNAIAGGMGRCVERLVERLPVAFPVNAACPIESPVAEQVRALGSDVLVVAGYGLHNQVHLLGPVEDMPSQCRELDLLVNSNPRQDAATAGVGRAGRRRCRRVAGRQWHGHCRCSGQRAGPRIPSFQWGLSVMPTTQRPQRLGHMHTRQASA